MKSFILNRSFSGCYLHRSSPHNIFCADFGPIFDRDDEKLRVVLGTGRYTVTKKGLHYKVTDNKGKTVYNDVGLDALDRFFENMGLEEGEPYRFGIHAYR